MPRRVYTYLPDRGWELLNVISTVGSFMFGLAVLLWIVDMLRNFRPFGPREAGNVFNGPGLEWLPNGLYSLRSIPVVKSLYPGWDQPDLGRDVAAGRYFLPGAPRGERETIVTSPLNAEPQYLQRMPRPSSWHVWGAIFTAGFFLILTVQAYAAAVISGLLAVYCIIKWCWNLDRPMPQATIDIGGGVRVPTYVSGQTSHGWWAMVITLIVAGMVCLLAGFAYVFLWSRRPDLWIAPPDMATLVQALVLLAAAGAAALAAPPALRLDRPRSAAISALLLLVACVALAWASWIDISAWIRAGLDPKATGQGATVFALMSWQALFAGITLIMGPFAVLRWLFGLASAGRSATFELISLFLAFTTAQGVFVLLLTRLFPGG
jgi:cytochrome c oxidase subunit I+III